MFHRDTRALLPSDALSGIGVFGGLLLLCVGTVVANAVLPAGYALKAGLLFAVGLACLLRGLAGAARSRHAGARRFGPANQVTLLRLTMVAGLGGLIGEAAGPHGWVIVGVAAVALLLDGVDGALARATHMSSELGARFDMETDALLVLVLSVLAWQLDKAGPWVLACGLMRYAYVAAGRMLPWLAAPVPPSRFRKGVCVILIVCLILALAPAVVPPVSTVFAAMGLMLLSVSFGRDIVWLARARRSGSTPSTSRPNPRCGA